MPTKLQIIEALHAFIRQRPGLEPGNYDRTSYAAEVRSIGRDLKDARTLLQAITWRDSISAESILIASRHAFSGRLTIVTTDNTVKLEYCTGQYWPTEYRKAVAAVCAAALWATWRTDATSATDIRRIATRELGRGIAQRWFR